VQRLRRAALLVAAVVLGVGLLAGVSHAALTLVFSRTTVEPGDVVRVRTGGSGALIQVPRKPPLRVFLAPKSAADHIRSPRDRRLRSLGALTTDRNGDGRLRFAVPNVPPGDYTTFIHCAACARYSNARSLLEAGPWGRPFRVRPGFRSCKSSIYADLGSGWEERSVRAGPLWLVRLLNYQPRMFEPAPGLRYRAAKVLIMVENGLTVMLKVPREMHGMVGLEYDRDSPFRRGSRSARVRDAGYAVTFEGCAPNEGSEGPHTLFNGAFVVARPICARLEITVAGRTEPISFAAPLGRTG
jgi:hypothetical protein